MTEQIYRDIPVLAGAASRSAAEQLALEQDLATKRAILRHYVGHDLLNSLVLYEGGNLDERAMERVGEFLDEAEAALADGADEGDADRALGGITVVENYIQHFVRYARRDEVALPLPHPTIRAIARIVEAKVQAALEAGA